MRRRAGGARDALPGRSRLYRVSSAARSNAAEPHRVQPAVDDGPSRTSNPCAARSQHRPALRRAGGGADGGHLPRRQRSTSARPSTPPAAWATRLDRARAKLREGRSSSTGSRPARRRASTAAALDYSKMDEQPGDDPRPVFSFIGSAADHPAQVSCWITHTSERTHQIIRDALHRSPLYSGQIEGIGPRYCPSIEDKWCASPTRPATRSSSSPKAWPSPKSIRTGISTSLPFDVQLELVRQIAGFEHAHHPPRLRHRIRFLRSARAEGVAGNEGRRRPVLRRPDQRHHRLRGSCGAGPARRRQRRALRAGTTRGARAATRPTSACWSTTSSPTARPSRTACSPAAPNTGLQLREDNADAGLTRVARELAWSTTRAGTPFAQARGHRSRDRAPVRAVGRAEHRAGRAIARHIGVEVSREANAIDLLRRPELDYATLMRVPELGPAVDDARGRRAGRDRNQVRRLPRPPARGNRARGATKPPRFPPRSTTQVPGLSAEVRQKLERVRPQTLGQAQRIPGMTPAAVSCCCWCTWNAAGANARPDSHLAHHPSSRGLCAATAAAR